MTSNFLLPGFPSISRSHNRSITLTSPHPPNSSRSPNSNNNLFDTLKPFVLPQVSARTSAFSKSPSTTRHTPLDFDSILKPKSILRGSMLEITQGSPELKKEKSIFNRGVKFNMMVEKPISNFQKMKEESSDRFMTVRKYIQEVDEIKREGNKQERQKEQTGIGGSNIADRYNQVLENIESTFLAMNIKLKETTQKASDSAMTIYPVEVNQDLITFYSFLMQEVCEFPYSFLSKLKIIMITVCNNVKLKNPTYLRILKQKINSGLIMIEPLKNREALRDHWYRIMIYHFVKVDIKFLPKWKENFGLCTYKKGEMEELIQILKCIMKPEKSVKPDTEYVDEKIKFFKDCLIDFDPMILNEEWSNLKRAQELY